MSILIRCFAGLGEDTGCDYRQDTRLDATPGATVEKVMASAGISPERVHMVFLNGRRASLNDPVGDGDRLAFAPPVGGM